MQVRHARAEDARRIAELINHHAEQGRMLHRSLESVCDSLRDFFVADDGGRVIGCVAVDVFWTDLAEVKSLAVDPAKQGRGAGVKLLAAAVEDARRLGLKRLFALTYETEFFSRIGFRKVQRGTLPEKVWRECIACPKADNCDEIAMIMRLDENESAAHTR